MKKIALFMTIAIVSSTSIIVNANDNDLKNSDARPKVEDYNLKTMTNSELEALLKAVRIEISERGGETDIHQGVYIVGDSIKSGLYTFTADSLTQLTLFNDESKYNEYCSIKQNDDVVAFLSRRRDYSYAMADLREGDSTEIDLKDGMILLIEHGSCYLENANVSWAP